MAQATRTRAHLQRILRSQRGKNGIRGQAMVLGIVMLLVLCIGVIILFDTGQAVSKKVELVNAADAAAYSVAVQQARALNFAAYSNRARVANEVAVAQVIGIYSWMNQLHTATIVFEKTMNVLSGIPYVGIVFKSLAVVFKAAGKVLKAARTTFHGVAEVAVRTIDELNGALATAANTILDYVSTVDGLLVARNVISRNSPDASLSAVGTGVLTSQLATAKSGFLHTYRIPRSSGSGSASARAGADRFRNVVMQSRDKFSWDRSGHDWNLGIIKFEQSGGTDMVDYNRWAAADALSLKVNLPWPLDDIDLPLGWGGAQAVESYKQQRFMSGFANGQGWVSEFNNNRRYRPYGDIRRDNRVASGFIDGDPNVSLDGGKKKGAYFTGYEGLRDYHDVQKDHALRPYTEPGRGDAQKNTGPIFTVHVQTDVANARTSAAIDGIGGPAGSPMAMEDKAANGKLSAMASGQVYFNRPVNYSLFKRGDNRLEVGNLFSPYWQARLVETPAAVEALLGISRL